MQKHTIISGKPQAPKNSCRNKPPEGIALITTMS
jgi:hypothetical protein